MPQFSREGRETVILINPQHHDDWNYGKSFFSFPISLMYLGTYLKREGFHVVIVDTCVNPDYKQQIRKHLEDAIYVGLTVMTPQVPHAYRIAKMIREDAPDVPLVWGGVHPTLYPGSCVDPFADITVLGEGEHSAAALANCLQTGGELENVPGIAWTENDEVKRTSPPPLMEMDKLPFVDYSLLDQDKYIPAFVIQDHRFARVIPIHASRGCPWQCRFCINTTLNTKRRYRPRSAENLLDEIEILVDQFDLEGVMLQDEEFFADRNRIVAFLDGIERRGLEKIRYYATSRVNHFRPGYINRDFLKRLKKCGFVDLLFGFESGSPYCLDLMKKEITVEQGLYVAQMLAEEGFKSVWGFIMAIPGERRRDTIRTLYVMEKLRRMNRDHYFIGPQIFRPYPGSELYREALESGLHEPKDLEEWSRFSFSSEGYLSSEHLPWIDPSNIEFINYLSAVSPVYFNADYIPSEGLKKILHNFLRWSFAGRLSMDFWKFPVEHKIRTAGISLLKKLKGNSMG